MLGIGIDYAIQMHARVEEEVVDRPRRAPDPGDRAQPRARPARRHLRRDLRLRRAALRQGADDPRVRPAARGRHRRDLPRARIIAAARDPRHPRVQVADQGPATSARGRSAASWCGSARSRRRARFRCSCSRASRSSSAASSSRTSSTLQTDPIQWVNQNSQVIKDIDEVERAGALVERARRVRHRARRVQRRRRPASSHDLHRGQLAKYQPTKLLTGVEHRDDGRRPASTCPGASDIAPTGADVKAAYDVAPDDIKASTVSPDDRAIEHRLPHRSRLARGPRARSCAAIRDDDPPARRHPRHAVGPRGRRRRPARQPRGQPDPAHLPRDPVRVPVPRGPAASRSSGRCCRWCRC